MKRKNTNIKWILFIILLILMGIQIFYGFRWMSVNFDAIPSFGDTTEYVQLSETLAPDEYRPIVYPVFLRLVMKLSEHLPVAYQSIVYMIQSVVSYMAIFYMIKHSIGRLIRCRNKREHLALLLYISLYLLCIPMITFLNFSILTDSFATTFMLFAFGSVSRLFYEKKAGLSVYLSLIISMLLQYLVRADRLYSGTLFLVIVFAFYMVKKRGSYSKIKTGILIFTTLAVTVSGCKLVNHYTQQPGLHGRIQTNFEFVLLDRIVWPNMEQNYDSFPQEIQDVISKEEARVFDEHNNNVMYQMAPLVESRVGHEKACDYYKMMAKTVFANQTKKVIFDVVEDVICVIFTPTTSFLSYHEIVQKADDWNLTCCSNIDKNLTYTYYFYYQYSFNLMLLIALIWLFAKMVKSILNKKKNLFKEEKSVFRCLAQHIFMCVIIALWFSVGDGAPPNDRYALLHYIIWGALVLGFFLIQKTKRVISD